MGKAALIFIFALQFLISFSEKLDFYFLLHENRAVNSSFIKSGYVKDVLRCARECAVNFNCNTANYKKSEKTCELAEERMSNIPNEVAIMAMEGCLLIEKVRRSFYSKEKGPKFLSQGTLLSKI